jgi:hypothetical protein
MQGILTSWKAIIDSKMDSLILYSEKNNIEVKNLLRNQLIIISTTLTTQSNTKTLINVI